MSATQAPVQRPAPGPFELIWSWLNSLPIAIAVMLLLAGLSALGTIIPQEHLAQPQGMTLEQMYIERFGSQRYQIINLLGLDHIYFTPYFFGLMLWLSVSAVVCNITRLRRTVRLWRKPPVARTAANLKAHGQGVEARLASPEAIERSIEELQHRRFRLLRMEKDGATYIYADHGFLKKWGLVLLHLSVLVLLFGGIFGKSLGVDGMIRLADGENKVLALDVSTNKYKLIQPLLKKLTPMEFELTQGAFRIDYDKSIEMSQEIRDKVPPELQDYYMYFVKDFVSTLSVSRNGKTVSQEVKVNHPLKLDRLVLYQSSYQQMGYISLKLNGVTEEYAVNPEDIFVLTPQGPANLDSAPASAIEGFYIEQVKAGDLYLGGKKDGYLGPLTILHRADLTTGHESTPMLLSPDSHVEVTVDGTIATLSMSKRVDNFSVFSYKRDPGIPVLYFGWIAMIIGISLALYIPFSQVWIRSEAGRVQYLISGAAGQPGTPLSARLHDILGAS